MPYVKSRKMSEAAFVKSPEPLKMGGNMSHTWDRWKRRFNIFLQASGLSTKGTKQKVGILLHIIGDEGLEIYENLDFLPRRTIDDQEIPAEDKDNFDCVIKKYDEYFTKRDPQLMLREKFWIHLKREPGQSFDAWTNLVKEKATECKFPDVYREQAVRDKLTFCCLDDSTKLRLYDQGADLTLPKAITIISLHEATSQELRESKTASIDVVQKKSAYNKRRSTNYVNKNHSDNRTCKQPTSNCGYCGKNHNRGIKNCPAAKATCHKCHKKGHYAHLCRSTYTASVHHVVQSTNNTQEVDEHSFVGVVSNQERNSGWYLKTRVNGKQLIWVVDTGAQRSIMPEALYKPSYGKLEQSDVTLIGAGDKTLDILGCVKMEISNENRRISETVYVIKGGSKLLLGIPGIRALGLLDDIPGTYSIRAVCHAKEVEPFTRNTSDCVKHKYPKLFSGLGKLSGQYNICLREEAKPFCITAPRRIPLPLLKKTEEEIQRMVNSKVIVPIEEPTDWCAPIVVVPKPSGNVRICVDLTKLNKAVKREVYEMPKVETTLGSIAEGTVYSKLDANSGFHQIELDPASVKLTTFITPFGRFAFNRLPYGITSAPEHFQKRMNQILAGLEGVVCHMDDILVVGVDKAQHDDRLDKVLTRLQESGLTLNPDKCHFAQTSLHYLGQIIDARGINKDPAKVQAIVGYPKPEDVTALRRFLGMVNQLMKFCPNLAELTKPLRDLLKRDTIWTWSIEQQLAFDKVKDELSSDRVLARYSPVKDTIISADASSYGLGAVLLQRQSSGKFLPVAFASRSMTETEGRYAQIEKEALAITWALEHWQDLVVGMTNLSVETDHKPLVPLFSTKLIGELPIRIQRFRMRLLRYNFTIKHVPGKELYTADALSRSPLHNTNSEDDLRHEADYYVNVVMVNLPASDKRLEEIRRELQNDEIMKQLKYYIVHGWPSKVTGPVKKYWPERASLTIHEGLILRGNQMLIPTSLRRDILRYLHDGHQGITKTRQNAANSVWWPHINTDIERIVRNCNICEKYRRERIEPMKGTEFPERPWSRVGADFFYHKGRNYIIAIDYYSRDVEICLVSNTCDTAETVVKVKKVFSRHGICDVLFTDNGPQFASAEFKAFANDWGFEHITSSPRYPQANGEAERAVQNIKSILNKCKDEYAALLNYRNTPLQNGFSPAQLSMGRRLKTRVPCNPEDLKPQTPDQTILRRKEKAYRDRMRYDYDRRHRVRDHSPVICGDKVWIPDLQTSGTVLRRSVHPRSLIIKTPRTVIRRNQRMVRKPTGDLSSTNPVLDFNIQKPISQTPVNISNDSAITDESEISTCNTSQHRDTPAIRPRRSNRTVKPPNRYIEEC